MVTAGAAPNAMDRNDMTPGLIWFLGWSLFLAMLLFFPVCKLVWTMSVRRMERKLDRKLNEQEIASQLQRARFLTVFLVAPFALLFNYNVFGIPS